MGLYEAYDNGGWWHNWEQIETNIFTQIQQQIQKQIQQQIQSQIQKQIQFGLDFMRLMRTAVGGITGCRRFLPRTELCIRLTQLAAQTQEHGREDDDDDGDDHDGEDDH